MKRNRYETLVLVWREIRGKKLYSYNSIAKKLSMNWDTVRNCCDCLFKLGLINQFSSLSSRKKLFNEFCKLTDKQRKEIFNKVNQLRK